ncbi:MAG: GC-type dockerin domain-anchored protein [Phycisphaerales bacterium JB060]
MKLDRYRIALIGGAVLGVSAGAVAQEFIVVENVTSLAAVSADGRYVTGLGNASQPGAFRLDTVTGEREVIGIGWPRDISADGSAIVGSIGIFDGAFLWTEAEGYINLNDTVPVLPGRSTVWAISDDGQQIAGEPTSGDAIRYSRSGEVVTLADCGQPYAISSDGATMAGFATFPGDTKLYAGVWDADGVATIIQRDAEATALSNDGRYAFGSMGDDRNPFRWSSDGGLESIETLPGARLTILWGASHDGRRAAGFAVVDDTVSMVWDEGVGARPLKAYLQDEHGIDLAGWSLKTLQNMSDDGLSFVGAATDPMGRNVWYVARAGEPCLADLDGNGVLNIFDFIEFQNLFVAGDLSADLDGDGELSIFDFLEFQSLFSAGC